MELTQENKDKNVLSMIPNSHEQRGYIILTKSFLEEFLHNSNYY